MASFRKWLLLLVICIQTKHVNDTVISGQLQCSPDKVMFIIDKFGKASFYQLRRFIVKCVRGLPNETSVYVVTVDNEHIKLIKFESTAGNESWVNDMGIESLTHGNISYEIIRDAIDIFFNKNKNSKMTELIIWLINGHTNIANDRKIRKAMRNKIVHIVFYGKHNKGDVWTKIARNERRIHELGDDTTAIIPMIRSVKSQLCIDIEFVCHFDQYWDADEKKCISCYYICKKTKSSSSELCEKMCPHIYGSEKTIEENLQIDNTVTLETLIYTTIIVNLPLYIVSVYNLCCSLTLWKKINAKNGRENVPLLAGTMGDRKDSVIEGMQAKITDLETKNESLNDEIKTVNCDNRRLSSNIEALKENNDGLKKQLEHVLSKDFKDDLEKKIQTSIYVKVMIEFERLIKEQEITREQRQNTKCGSGLKLNQNQTDTNPTSHRSFRRSISCSS